MVEKLDFGNSDSSGSALDWFSGFGKSALESIPELIGITPSESTQQFRQDNPVSGVISELAGSAVPYLGWFSAAKRIGTVAKAAELLGSSKNAFLAGAGRTAAQLAPLEAVRIAGNEAFGDQSFGQMLGATATDLALGSGIGGLLHGISYSGLRDPKLPSIFPGIDVSLPLPLMARQMREIIASGKITDPDLMAVANRKLIRTLDDARSETLHRGQKYVGSLENAVGRDANSLERQLNRLFRGESGEDKVTNVRKFAIGDGTDFPSKVLWDAEATEAGLPKGFEEHGQYFRNITFNRYNTRSGLDVGEKQAKMQSESINNILTRNMESVGDGNFMAREANDGLFVIARKYEGGVKKGSPGDRWILFKTDKPGFFLPGPDKWSTLQAKIGSWQPNLQLFPDAGPIYNALSGYLNQFPYRDWLALQRDGKMASVIKSLLPKD